MELLVRAFIISRKAEGCTPRTIVHHETSLKHFVTWAHSVELSDDPEDWRVTDLRGFIVWLQELVTHKGTPLSGYSVTTYSQSFKTFLRWLHLEELTATDLSAKIKKPRPPQQQKQPYTDDDLRRLLAAVKGNLRDTAILSVLIDCGLRANEVCILTTFDVNLSQQLIYVRQGKGRKDRVVPFSAQTARAITKHLSKRRDDIPYLFPSTQRDHLNPNSLRQLVERVAARAEVENAYVHRFRHTFAISWLRHGGDVFTLRKVMGHADLATTQGYVNLLTDDLQRGHSIASPLSHLVGSSRKR